jgi:anti-sigma-K factor RskA
MTDWLGMIPKPRTPRPELRARVLARALQGRPRFTWGLAAAAVLAALLVGGAWWAGTTISGLRAEVAALRDTLGFVHSAATRVARVPVRTGEDGQVGAVVIFADSATRRWLVRCEGMAPNEPHQTYQIWFVTERGPTPAGLMTMTHTEPTVMTMGIDVPADLGAPVVGLAMSVEPRGGSVRPSGPILFQVRL